MFSPHVALKLVRAFLLGPRISYSICISACSKADEWQHAVQLLRRLDDSDLWLAYMILLMEEILHQLIGSLSHYLQGFRHPRCRISCINNIKSIKKRSLHCYLPVLMYRRELFSSNIWVTSVMFLVLGLGLLRIYHIFAVIP